MRSAVLFVLCLLCSTFVIAQEPDAALRVELESLHAKWFKAFDGGDPATMDQMETDKLVLIMPTGMVWSKSKSRVSEGAWRPHEGVQRTLSAVSVRRFGDTAILTGMLHSKSAEENTDEATTVVFVHSGGKWKIASAQWTVVESKK